MPSEAEEGGGNRRTCGVQQVRRPALFDLPNCLIKEPPTAGVTAPCSDYEFCIIEKYVERANALKEALIGFDEVLLEHWDNYTEFHRECRLNQNVFAGPRAFPVTEANLKAVKDLADKLSQLAMHHEELRSKVCPCGVVPCITHINRKQQCATSSSACAGNSISRQAPLDLQAVHQDADIS